MGLMTKCSFFKDPRFEKVAIKNPFVTLVVTNYNYSKYVVPCLESIANQTYKTFKCIVVDDCSTDDSPALIEAFVKSELAEGRFSYVRHEKNLGQLGSFATGLKYAEGPFISFVDADDLLLEDFIEQHLQAHTSFEPVAFTSSNQYQINESGELIGGNHSDHKSRSQFRYVASRSVCESFWVWATTSSMMFRRSVLEMIMPENVDQFRICADYYICHFANLIGGSLLIPSIHGCYRRHGRNNFSCNSMVGGCHPTGDLDNHPEHHLLQCQIFDTMCEKSDQFISTLGKSNFYSSLINAIGPIDLIRRFSSLPKCAQFFPLLMCSLIFWIKRKTGMARALVRGEFKVYDYGEERQFLKFPGES